MPEPCRSRCSVSCAGAASCSASPAASIRASRRRSPSPRVGAKKVLGVLMPERDSDPDSLRLGHLVADNLGIETVVEDIAPIL